MKLRTALIAVLPWLLIGVACRSESKGPPIPKNPASIRGWLVDPAAESQPLLHLTDTASGEAAHRARVFEQTHISIEGFPYASGGIGGNGSFVILDVPPGQVIINFQPPEGPDAQLLLKDVPPNADILLPRLRIQATEVVPSDPKDIVVRVPARVTARRPTGSQMTVAGQPVPVFEVPLSEMLDRRDYPQPTP